LKGSEREAKGLAKVRARLDRIVRRLQREATWTTPVVSKIARRRRDPFRVLVSTLLSLRTKDEVTDVASRRLLQLAPTPRAILRLTPRRIEKLIYPVGFYRTKAKRLLEVSRILLEEHGGKVPSGLDELLELPGVGRKTANLVLVEGYGEPAIAVDTHVHRISNRLGVVRTKTPHHTEAALRDILPRRHWVVYNELLVGFGKAVCRPISPLCSRCPVRPMCDRIGVGKHR
jgi:endonuclease-3